jgi:hypothetical protein
MVVMPLFEAITRMGDMSPSNALFKREGGSESPNAGRWYQT